MIDFLIGVAWVVGYGLMMGITWGAANNNEWGSDGCDKFFIAAGWPLTIPIRLGMYLSGFAPNSGRMPRAERRRLNEIDEARHQRELAILSADEAEHITRALEAHQK